MIDWLATQDWSSGNVGMFGTSYGGFNSLQAALENPPALKAIVPIFASDDRYDDDVHYYGGALKHVDLVDYPTYMVAMNALPPVPGLWGEDWRDEWQRRLERTEPWVLTWLAHQRRDEYWRYGSAREDIATHQRRDDDHRRLGRRVHEHRAALVRADAGARPAADRPVVARLAGELPARTEHRRHRRDPSVVRPMAEGDDNGIDREPPIVVYQQRSTAPDPLRSEVRGVWRAEPTWPPERLRTRDLALGDAESGGVAGEGPTDALTVAGDVGVTAWISCAGGLPWGQSADQRPDEERSLTYTWAPLGEELEMFGHPHLRLTLTSDRPIAYLSAKITDVFPDGASSLVVRGMTNIAHRDEPVAPGEPFELDLQLEAIAWTFEAGHRIRLDIAGADWPNAWPPPYAATLAIDRASAMLELPVLDGPPVADPPAIRVVTGHQHGLESNDEGWWRWEVDEPADGDARRSDRVRRHQHQRGRGARVPRPLRRHGRRVDHRSRHRLLRRRGRVRDRVPRSDRSHPVASARRLHRRGVHRLDRAHRATKTGGTILETLGSRDPARRTVGDHNPGGCPWMSSHPAAALASIRK